MKHRVEILSPPDEMIWRLGAGTLHIVIAKEEVTSWEASGYVEDEQLEALRQFGVEFRVVT